MSCNQFYCLWVQDSQNPDHYVCLKCDRERWIHQSNSLESFLILVAIAVPLALFINSFHQDQTSVIEPPTDSYQVNY